METPQPEAAPKTAPARAASGFCVHLVVAYALVAAVLAARAFLFRSEYLGKIWLSPLFTYWDPRFSWRLLPAAAAVAGGTALLVWGVRARKHWVLPLGAFVNVAAISLGPAFGRTYPLLALNRYLLNMRAVFDVPNVFAGYVEAMKNLSSLGRTRPGLTFWSLGLVDRLCESNIYGILFAYVAAAAAAVWVLYAAARVITGREEALLAAALFACSPALLFFGAGPVGLYCLLGTALLALGLKAASSPTPRRWAAAAGVVLAVALLTYFPLGIYVAVFATFGVAAAVSGRRWTKAGLAWLLAPAVAATALAAFQLATGYDHLAVFKTACRANQELPSAGNNAFVLIGRLFGRHAETASKAAARPYWFYAFGNLFTAFVAVGIPVGILYLRGVFRIIRQKQTRRSFYGATTVGFLLVFLAFNFSGLVLGEVERVWLFLYPAFFVAAGAELAGLARRRCGGKLVVGVFALVMLQSFVYKIFLF
ncbi:MAG TPA: glycosyltransferase family 39 protein [bacterium]|nr:glycosyltransferase family 39 protein [bacterium]